MRNPAEAHGWWQTARAPRFRRHGSRVAKRGRHAVVATMITALAAGAPISARGQLGQTAMAPGAGVVNRAVQGFQNLNANGPGILYYGINAADRGLGYVGSYMTLGGYIPGFEDDLGGLWAADLRSHLSVYGGFFSNVGAVRKQFLGGSLLGIGVYWDYDGDLNQYSPITIPGTTSTFAGGQVYNQVGVSGEWLTDWGNLRSNGYIPVGTTAEYVGPFVQNVVLCQNGVNAGLAGTDLEVGAYIPGLNDWAGMISVGGYAYGNARYDFPDGQDVVPWFGGVYTRLDMTFLENWDFSLQYNNDSYFDSTGFARLTYRMGGSRRRNVPDQMEQPMMRNEHIVRAHQEPVVAINPETLAPWRVFHVDNAAQSPGTGSAGSPFTSLSSAQDAAKEAYDIVYVHRGTSSVANPYLTPTSGYSFQAENQYLVGEGSSLAIPTVSCGPRSFFAGDGSAGYPVLSSPLGPAIVIDQPGTVVSHFQIVNTTVGITDGGGLPFGGVATVSDVIIEGSGPGQRGVEISNSKGRFDFDRLQLKNLTNDGFVLSADSGNVSVSNSAFRGVQGKAFVASGSNSRATITNTVIADVSGTAVAAEGGGSSIVLTSATITDTKGVGVAVTGAAASVKLTTSTIGSSPLVTSGSLLTDRGVVVSGSGAKATIDGSAITSTISDGLVVSGPNASATLNASKLDRIGGNGALVSGFGAALYVTGTSEIRNAKGDGIRIRGSTATLLVQDSTVRNSGNDGVSVTGTSSPTRIQATLLRSSILQSANTGVAVADVSGTGSVVQVYGTRISGAQVAGVSALNSNVDVAPDPTVANGAQTSITNTGIYGIQVRNLSTVAVTRTSISSVPTGISAVNTTRSTVLNLTANSNTISVSGSGTGIAISGVAGIPPDTSVDPPTPSIPPARVHAQVLSNRITVSGSTGITLITLDPPDPSEGLPVALRAISINDASDAAELKARNFGVGVLEDPAPDLNTDPPQGSLIDWNAVHFDGNLPARPPELPPVEAP